MMRTFEDNIRSLQVLAKTMPDFQHRLTLTASQAEVVAEAVLTLQQIRAARAEQVEMIDSANAAIAAVNVARRKWEARERGLMIWFFYLAIAAQVQSLLLSALAAAVGIFP